MHPSRKRRRHVSSDSPPLGLLTLTTSGISEHVFMVDVLKYAVVERERRFVVAGIPEGVTQTLRIEDYYIEHTRLRLRRVMAADGSFTRKLGHKVRLGQGASTIACTSMYLDEEEWNVLLTLPHRTLHKTRHIVERDGAVIAIDALDDGTLLAEIDDGDSAPGPVPIWLDVLQDVTHDEAWTGASRAS
jgi:CYTH domain-containing protein